jgi:hypothetical protein
VTADAQRHLLGSLPVTWFVTPSSGFLATTDLAARLPASRMLTAAVFDSDVRRTNLASRSVTPTM